MSGTRVKISPAETEAVAESIANVVDEITLENRKAADEVGVDIQGDGKVVDKENILKLLKFFLQGGQFIIDTLDYSPYTDVMEEKKYTEEDLQKARSDAFKEATLLNLSAQSGIPIKELQSEWNSGKFDGREAKAIRERHNKSMEEIAKEHGVSRDELRGSIVSKNDFLKTFS